MAGAYDSQHELAGVAHDYGQASFDALTLAGTGKALKSFGNAQIPGYQSANPITRFGINNAVRGRLIQGAAENISNPVLRSAFETSVIVGGGLGAYEMSERYMRMYDDTGTIIENFSESEED